MKFALLTKNFSPGFCGIADHSISLVKALGLEGESVIIVADRGYDLSIHVDVVVCDWSHQGLDALFKKMVSLDLDHLILQFTPLMYVAEKTRNAHELVQFWQRCSQRWVTSIIVHETYFRTWWHPKSWGNGMLEKRLLKTMVEYSHFAFSASHPLVDEMREWRMGTKVAILPIGSSFSLVGVDKEKIRRDYGIAADEVVLVLFGGGNSLKWMKKHVYATDALLHSKGIKARWLMLGGITASWFKLKQQVILPGWLDERQISIWLQASDIFLMPHYAGLCAKRGTLMAALQHALPVVGTRSEMTDKFWDELDGVYLTRRHIVGEFAQQVLALVLDNQLRADSGKANQEYFHNNCTWPIIAKTFLVGVHK